MHISRIRLSDKTSRLRFSVQRLLQFLNTLGVEGAHPQRTSHGNYHCTGTDPPVRRFPSHQYSPAVISPASGNSAVIGSAAQRRKNTKKFLIGRSGPLLPQAINVNDTNSTAPSTNPSRQTLKPVICCPKESKNRQGRKTPLDYLRDRTGRFCLRMSPSQRPG
jgi:hypothetical protein